MREVAVDIIRHLAGLLLFISLTSPTATAQTGRVSGTVRIPEGNPVAGVLVTLTAGFPIRSARTDAAGSFRFVGVAEGSLELRVTLPGFSPWLRRLDVKNGATVSVDVVIQPLVQTLDSALVTAMRSGIFGVIADMETLKLLDSAVVQVIGFRSADTTRNGGEFNLHRVTGGRNYVVRVARRGYRTRVASVTVPTRGGVELLAFLEPGTDRRTKDENVWREFDNRAHYGGNNTALVTRADLGGVARSNLMTRLMQARPLLLKSLRLHPAAVYDPMSPAYPCIFVNGRPAPQSTLLDQFAVGDIEAIEAYGFGTQQHERLAGKFAAMSMGRPCGAAPTRSMTFEGPTKGEPGFRTPAIRESTARGMIAVVVIWLRPNRSDTQR